MGSLVIYRFDGARAIDMAWASRRDAVQGPVVADAELTIATPGDEAIVLGAFQRSSDAGPSDLPKLRRGSGGPAVRVGPEMLWLRLVLQRPDVLLDADPSKLLNRYVRPLLRAITKAGATARYFGRDWVSVDHRPAALVAFAHDSTVREVPIVGRPTQRERKQPTLFEAFVSARASVWLGERASFLGKEPLVIDRAPRVLAEAIVAAYSAASTSVLPVPTAGFQAVESDETGVADDPPWTATREEAIGPIHAGRDREGKLRLGGELMASHDAVTRLEERVATTNDFSAAVDETLAAPGVALFGVRSLANVRDVLVEAAQKPA